MRKFLSQVPSFIITAAKLFLLEFMILVLCRIIFFFALKTPDVSQVPVTTVLWAFRMGFEFDMIATCYAISLPCLLLLLNEFFNKRSLFFHQAGFLVTLLIFWLYAFVSAADFPYFNQFGSHLSRQAFLWTASPGFILKMIFGTVSYYGYLFLFVLFAVAIYMALKRIYRSHLARLREHSFSPVRNAVFAVALVPLLIVGSRGRTSGKSTTHEGLAIVSDNSFVNQIALNPDFTLFRSLLFQKVKTYEVPAGIDESIRFARNYLGIAGSYKRSVERMESPDSAFRPMNIVIVCMESMSSYKMGIHNHEVLTPNFNNIVKESVYFDRFFSSGIHTFNGLFSTATGFPSLPGEHGLRRYTRQPFTNLANLLQKKNYEASFYSTHDPHFDNMEGFFKENGYPDNFSALNLPHDKSISATGVPDHELFNLFFSNAGKADKTRPFISFIMTGSDHGPWVIPENIPFKPTSEDEYKRATQYADWALGQFMETAKKQSWYENTLFVFLGDHGYAISNTFEMPLSYHNVPFVLHSPRLLKPDTVHHLGYQPDVLATVAALLNLPFDNTSFGINIMKKQHPFVYFQADDKVGCLSDDGYYFYELMSQKTKRLRRYMDQELDMKDYYEVRRAKADSLEQCAKHMLDAAEYFIRKDYFSY